MCRRRVFRNIFYLTAVVGIAATPGLVLVGCAGFTGNKEIPPPQVFTVQHEFETPEGIKVQVGFIDNDPTRLGQRQEHPDGSIVWLEKVEPWIPGVIEGGGSVLGYGALAGSASTLLTLLGVNLAKRKWLNAS